MVLGLLISIYSCQKDVFKPADISLVKGGNPKNPYSLKNMQIAVDSMITMSRPYYRGKDSIPTHIKLEKTDLYIRFIPEDSSQYEVLLSDTSLRLFEVPLDDPKAEAPPAPEEGMVPVLYTRVPVGYAFPHSVAYEIIEELFIPEHSPYYSEDTTASGMGKTGTPNALDMQKLEMLSMYLTDNLPEAQVQQIEQAIKNKKVCFLWWCWYVPDDWRPSGRIMVKENSINQERPIEGIRVQARAWFRWAEGITNSQGYYTVNRVFPYWASTHMQISFKRWRFRISNNGIFRVKFWGPWIRRSSWNLTVTPSMGHNSLWLKNFAAFEAAYDYIYKPSMRAGTVSPYKHGFVNVVLRNNTRFASHALLAGLNTVFLYVGNKLYESTYAITIHELAHLAHKQTSHIGYTSLWVGNNATVCNGVKVSRDRRLLESWAEAVELHFLNLKFKRPFLDRSNPINCLGNASSIEINRLYTSFIIDLIDTHNQRKQRSANHPEDEISGYTLAQINEALRYSRTYSDFLNHLPYPNALTKKKVSNLFHAWDK